MTADPSVDLYADAAALRKRRQLLLDARSVNAPLAECSTAVERRRLQRYWLVVVAAAALGALLIIATRGRSSGAEEILSTVGGGLLSGSAIGAVWEALDTRGKTARAVEENALLITLQLLDTTLALVYLRVTADGAAGTPPDQPAAGGQP